MLDSHVNRLLSALLIGLFALSGTTAAVQGAEGCTVPPEIAATRPNAEAGPTPVTVHLLLIDLRGVHDTAQAYEADIVMSLEWRDPRLVDGSAGSSLANCRVPLGAIWTPNAIVLNERDVSRRLPEVAVIDPEGLVSTTQRYMGEFTSPLELQDFPFDMQDLTFEVVAARHSPDEVEFRVVPMGRDPSMEISIADWKIGPHSVVYEPLHLAGVGRSVARFSSSVEVTRDRGFYVLKVLIPLCLIVFMSWGVFWINPRYLPPQIGVSTSAVLTLIAFQFSLGYLLPRVSYLTLADRFLFGASALVFLAFGEALWTSSLADRGEEAKARKIDGYARILFPLGFVAVLVISLIR